MFKKFEKSKKDIKMDKGKKEMKIETKESPKKKKGLMNLKEAMMDKAKC